MTQCATLSTFGGVLHLYYICYNLFKFKAYTPHQDLICHALSLLTCLILR